VVEITCSECSTVFQSKQVEFLDTRVASELPETCLYCRQNIQEAKKSTRDSAHDPAFVLTPSIMENCVELRVVEGIDSEY